LCVVGLFTACGNSSQKNAAPTGNNDSLFVSGSFAGLDSGSVLLSTSKDNDIQVADTMFVHGGRFEGKIPLSSVSLILVATNGQQLSFAAKAGELVISGKVDSINDAHITGTAIPHDLEEYDSKSRVLNDSIAAHQQVAATFNRETTAATKAEWLNKMQFLLAQLWTVDSIFIEENPESYMSAERLYQSNLERFDLARFEKGYNSLSDSVKAGYYGKRAFKLLETLRKPFPDIQLNDVKGTPVSLLSLKGEYTLVDFWASWCVPCREEIPNLMAAYQTYKDRGLRVVGVSLDTDKKAWLASIKKDAMSWPQLSDLKGWDAASVKLYDIKAIPDNFLLDKDGRVIARALTGQHLQQKLAEIFP